MGNRFDKILKDAEYLRLLEEIEELEKKRIYCKHGLTHLLDVARIATIIWLEEGSVKNVNRDIIYAAALLHDIGRGEEYKEGTSHDEASALIAGKILQRCGYAENETGQIVSAIYEHRGRTGKQQTYLGKILAKADKLSRECFRCDARESCKWSEEDKNKTLLY